MNVFFADFRTRARGARLLEVDGTFYVEVLRRDPDAPRGKRWLHFHMVGPYTRRDNAYRGARRLGI